MSALQHCANDVLLAHSPGQHQACWFALQVRPRFEKKAALDLQERGLTAFLPLYSTKHQWSDRQRLVRLPLFPGYVFVQIAPTLDIRVSVLRANGVIRFAGVRGVGIPIPDNEIEALQAVIEMRIPFEPYLYLKIGQRVRIRGGALDGVEGILMAINGDQSLIVSVNLIQRSIAMRITGYKVEPIDRTGGKYE
jgi:transcriptional antiterminator NusG